jgi:hypothetical protein
MSSYPSGVHRAIKCRTLPGVGPAVGRRVTGPGERDHHMFTALGCAVQLVVCWIERGGFHDVG